MNERPLSTFKTLEKVPMVAFGKPCPKPCEPISQRSRVDFKWWRRFPKAICEKNGKSMWSRWWQPWAQARYRISAPWTNGIRTHFRGFKPLALRCICTLAEDFKSEWDEQMKKLWNAASVHQELIFYVASYCWGSWLWWWKTISVFCE